MARCIPRAIYLVPMRTQASRQATSLGSVRPLCSGRGRSCQEWIIGGKWLPLKRRKGSQSLSGYLGDLLVMKVTLRVK